MLLTLEAHVEALVFLPTAALASSLSWWPC